MPTIAEMIKDILTGGRSKQKAVRRRPGESPAPAIGTTYKAQPHTVGFMSADKLRALLDDGISQGIAKANAKTGDLRAGASVKAAKPTAPLNAIAQAHFEINHGPSAAEVEARQRAADERAAHNANLPGLAGQATQLTPADFGFDGAAQRQAAALRRTNDGKHH